MRVVIRVMKQAAVPVARAPAGSRARDGAVARPLVLVRATAARVESTCRWATS